MCIRDRDTVLLCTGGYGNVFFLSTNAMGCNVTAAYKAYKRGAFFANPCFTQDVYKRQSPNRDNPFPSGKDASSAPGPPS